MLAFIGVVFLISTHCKSNIDEKIEENKNSNNEKTYLVTTVTLHTHQALIEYILCKFMGEVIFKEYT